MVHDFSGVALNLYQNGSVFADSVVVPNIANLYKNWSSSEVNVKRVPRNVLGRNADSNTSKWVLHEVGSWIEDGDVARYTRWSYTGSPFGWQIETDVDLRETDNKIEPSDYADAIRERYAVYNSLYKAGNFSGLVADLYTSDAVLALTTGSFVERDSLEHSLSLFHDADPLRNFSVSVAVGKEGVNVVHDLGTISMGSQRYYARWEKCVNDWKIAVQVHDGPSHHRPRDGNGTDHEPHDRHHHTWSFDHRNPHQHHCTRRRRNCFGLRQCHHTGDCPQDGSQNHVHRAEGNADVVV